MLYSRDFSGAARPDGATIYTAGEDEFNRVEISVIYNGDTAGFDAGEYFTYRAEDMASEDGSEYTLCEEKAQSACGSAVVRGAVYSFMTEDGRAYRQEMLVDTGTQLIRYSCYYYDGEDDLPCSAMTDASSSAGQYPSPAAACAERRTAPPRPSIRIAVKPK